MFRRVLRLLWLVGFFLCVHASVQFDSGMNPWSRWAAMASFAETGTPQIDHYRLHTVDWALAPDGHYYSNKPPGPILLGLPLFLLFDQARTQGLPTLEERDVVRVVEREDILHLLAMVLQAVPYAIAVLLAMALLAEYSVPPEGMRFACIALLFGSTGSLLMNSYFGHGMAVLFVLATWLALCRQRPLLVGLFFGLAVTCDYASTLLGLPVFVWLWLNHPQRVRALAWCALGGLGPFILFGAYHWYCFGGPFTSPNQFQNPMFIDPVVEDANLWGMLRLLPPIKRVKSLLFGTHRGILWTQPWVLVAVPALAFALYRNRKSLEPRAVLVRRATAFALASFFLVFWMNSGFNGYHGGYSPGPRYLSITFAPLALAIGLSYSAFPVWLRQALDLALFGAVLLFLLVFSTEILLTPPEAIAPFYFHQFLTGHVGLHAARFVCMALPLLFATWQVVGRRTVPSPA
ncbi:MAG: hypothetical protein ACOY0T_00080 [Myxococcota bacterium]